MSKYLPDCNAIDDVGIVDQLVNFVRTPEWSVSMMEDIAALVTDVREVDVDFSPDDPLAWEAH